MLVKYENMVSCTELLYLHIIKPAFVSFICFYFQL